MKIDEQIEPLVREALGAAVKRELDRFSNALDAFDNDTKRGAGLALVYAIGRLVLHDLYEGRNPTDDQIRDFAEYIAESESWAELPGEEIRAYLLWLLGDDSKKVDQDLYIPLVFVVTATMLSYRRLPEGRWWYDYLDQIEAALEALPESA